MSYYALNHCGNMLAAYILSIIIVSLIVWFWKRWRDVAAFWAKQGVPHKTPNPFVGSLTFIQKQYPGNWMRHMYDEFKTPLIGIWIFWRPGLIVNCPDIARQVLVKDSEVFKNRLLSSGKSDPIGAFNIFTVDDPLWSTVRKRMSPIFTSARLRSLQHIYCSKSRDLVERIRTDVKNCITIDLRSLFSDYTTDVIGEAAFGVYCNATTTGHSALRSVTHEFMKFNVWRAIAWTCIFFKPEMVDLFRFSFFPNTAVQSIRSIFKTIVAQRGGYDKETYENRDMLDMLLKMKKEAATENNDISEDVLIAQAAIMLQGGFDTTAVTMTFAVYELAFDAERQEKLYQELSEARVNLGGKEIDPATLSELCYLNCVIKEILRLYPAMSWLDRVAAKDYQLNDKVTIPAGTAVYINALGMQRSAANFHEPDTFRPERFLPENEKDVIPYTYLPFGEGPRMCIGKRFAYNSMRQGLSSVILNFELRPLPDAKPPQLVDLEKKSMFLCPAGPLFVQFIPRT